MNPDYFKGYTISWTIPANNPRGFKNVTVSAKNELADALIEEQLKAQDFAEALSVISRIKSGL